MERIIGIWQWFRETLLFHMVEALILVIGLLLVAFAFLPSEAIIAVENGKYVPQSMFWGYGHLMIAAKGCQINLKNATCSVMNDCKTRMSYCSIIVDDAEYGPSQLKIENDSGIRILVPEETELTIFTPLKTKESGSMYVAGLSDGCQPSFHGEIYISSEGPFYIEPERRSRLFLEIKKDFQVEEKEIDRCKVVPQFSSRAVMTISEKEGMYAYNEGTVRISISDLPWKDGDFKKQLAYANVTSADITMNGNVNFVYTLEPQVYPIYQQALKLKNEGEGLNAIIEGYPDGSETISFYGKVTEASIGNRSLFPSFKKWFLDNAYLAPSALLSIFIGAAALMTEGHKSNKEQ